jgi:hypothetical protein
MFEDLKALIDGAQGEALDVPHPNQLKNTEKTAITRWHRSEKTSDFETNMLGGPLHVQDEGSPDWGKPLTYVSGQINRVVIMDDYHEPMGEPEYVMLHKVANPKAKNADISSAKIGSFGTRDLRRRFPAAFAEFEVKLKAEGTPLPIALLDEVPPHVIHMLITKGCKTVQQFADYDDDEMRAMKITLEAQKMNARVPFLVKYRDQARAKVGYVEPEAAPKAKQKVAA